MILSRGLALMAGFLITLAGLGCKGHHSEQGLDFRGWYVVKPAAPEAGSVAYGVIRNHSGSAKTLTGADFGCAASTALHETVESAGRVSMKPLPALEILPEAVVIFEPGHKHVMLGTLKPEATEKCEAAFLFNDTTVRFKMPVQARRE